MHEEKYQEIFWKLQRGLSETKRIYETLENVPDIVIPSPIYLTEVGMKPDKPEPLPEDSGYPLKRNYVEEMYESLNEVILTAEDVLNLLKDDGKRMKKEGVFPDWYRENVGKFRVLLQDLKVTANFVLSNRDTKKYISEDAIRKMKNDVVDLLKQAKLYFKEVAEVNEGLSFLKKI